MTTTAEPGGAVGLAKTTRRRRESVMATIEEAIEEYRAGRFVVIVDDEDRENEGDLTIPAEFVTAEHINFMARYGRGLICMPMTGERIEQLGIPMMVSSVSNNSRFGTPFTVSVEARTGVTTGISAHDRARTVQVLIDPRSTNDDLVMPGHLFPLRAREGGVLVRAGQTEAVVDLCRLAGLHPAGVLCEIMRADGTMARMPDLKRFAQRHRLKVISVDQLIAYRQRHERLVQRVAETLTHLRASLAPWTNLREAEGRFERATVEYHEAQASVAEATTARDAASAHDEAKSCLHDKLR